MRYLTSIWFLVLGLACVACQTNGQSPPQSSPKDMKQSPDSLALYLDQLGSEHGPDRGQAIDWLSRHPQWSRTHLRELATDQEQSWRASGALEALGQIGQEEDVSLLVQVCQANPQLSFEAAKALSVHAHPESLQALMQLAQSDSEPVAANGLVALGLRQDEAARPILETALHSASATLRWKAAHALGLLGPDGSQELLKLVAEHDSNQEVREKAAAVLGGE